MRTAIILGLALSLATVLVTGQYTFPDVTISVTIPVEWDKEPYDGTPEPYYPRNVAAVNTDFKKDLVQLTGLPATRLDLFYAKEDFTLSCMYYEFRIINTGLTAGQTVLDAPDFLKKLDAAFQIQLASDPPEKNLFTNDLIAHNFLDCSWQETTATPAQGGKVAGAPTRTAGTYNYLCRKDAAPDPVPSDETERNKTTPTTCSGTGESVYLGLCSPLTKDEYRVRFSVTTSNSGVPRKRDANTDAFMEALRVAAGLPADKATRFAWHGADTDPDATACDKDPSLTCLFLTFDVKALPVRTTTGDSPSSIYSKLSSKWNDANTIAKTSTNGNYKVTGMTRLNADDEPYKDNMNGSLSLLPSLFTVLALLAVVLRF